MSSERPEDCDRGETPWDDDWRYIIKYVKSGIEVPS